MSDRDGKLIMDRESMGYACPKKYIQFGDNLYKLDSMSKSYAFYSIVDESLSKPDDDKPEEKPTLWQKIKRIFMGNLK